MAALRPCRFGVGASFSDYEAFEEAFNGYCDENGYSFTKNGRSAANSNREIKDCSRHFAPKFKYSTVRFYCKHFGSYTSRSNGRRANQSTCKLKCATSFLLSANRQNDCLVIKEWNDDHLTEDGRKSHPSAIDPGIVHFHLEVRIPNKPQCQQLQILNNMDKLSETSTKQHGRKRPASTEQETGRLKRNGRQKQMITATDSEVVLKQEAEIETDADVDLRPYLSESWFGVDVVKTEPEDDLDENSRLSPDLSTSEEETVQLKKIKTEPLLNSQDSSASVNPTGLVVSLQHAHGLEQQVQILQAKVESQESEICKLNDRNRSLLQLTIDLTEERNSFWNELKGRCSQTVPVISSNVAADKSTLMPLFLMDAQGNVSTQHNGENPPNVSSEKINS